MTQGRSDTGAAGGCRKLSNTSIAGEFHMLDLSILSATAFANHVRHGDLLLSGPAVCALLGVSRMTLHRWVNGGEVNPDTGQRTPPVQGFPQPRYIQNRRYWLRAEIENFIASKVA